MSGVKAVETTKTPDSGRTLLAPVWHTGLLATAVMAASLLGLRTQSLMAAHHVRLYLETIGWEWALAAAVLWGLRIRRSPLDAVLGRPEPGLRGWAHDALAAAIFWIGSAVVLAAVAVLLKLAHLQLPEKSLSGFAPNKPGELLLFLVLSVSAGVCEELLFRGYFQQQFARLAGGRVWAGVLGGSLLFGLAHLYEGAAGVVAITIFGGMFSLLALRRGNLRAGMMAHAWHDALSGVMLFFLRHTHSL